MKATTGTRRSLRAPLLLAAFLGLATSASGCIIESDSGPGPCLPNIYIPWALVRAGTDQPVTCATAGAYYIEAFVTDRAYEDPCLAGQTVGTMTIPAAGPGSYNIVVSLLDVNRLDVVPPTPPLTVVIPNNCADVTTPYDAVFDIP
jgi:hypothetical protein